MDTSELLEYLKANLTLNVFCSSIGELTVELYVEGQQVTKSECYLPEKIDRPYWE